MIYDLHKSNKKFLIPESGFFLISSMRLLNRYIQKELFLPFIFSLLIIVFILFTNFFLRALDRFLGKGLDLPTILEYLVLNLAWIISLAVPMAVLIATLMSFGRMSEDNEIIASIHVAVGRVGLILKKDLAASYSLKDALDIRIKMLGIDHPLTL